MYTSKFLLLVLLLGNNGSRAVTWRAYHPEPGGGSFTKIVRGCACRTSKIWLSLYQFFAKFSTHQYTIFERKAPNLDQIGCFLQKFAQNTPDLCNLGSFVSDENPPIAIPNFAKRCPKRQAHIRIPCQCKNPPPGPRVCVGEGGAKRKINIVPCGWACDTLGS